MRFKSFRGINVAVEEDGVVSKQINDGREALEAEVRALTLLDGCRAPKLISICGSTIEMEKIDGKPLSKCKLDKELVKDLANALNFLHSHRKGGLCLIHGDLHKNNIIVSKEGIKFVDFTNSRYADPLLDAAAVEIHVINDPKLLSAFYRALHVKRDRQTIDRHRVTHCLQHLEWAEKEGHHGLAKKSRRIIEEVRNGADHAKRL